RARTRPARSRRGGSPRRAPTSASASPSTSRAACSAGARPPWRPSRASACASCVRASCPRPSCARRWRRADGRRPSARRPPLRSRPRPGPKADRLALLRATGANLGAIFGLYARPGEPVRELLAGAELGAPLVDVSGWHQLWRVTDAPAIARVEAALADRTVIIADG